MEKIRSRADLMAFVKKAYEMVERYGWQDRETYPYSFPIKVTKILRDCKSFDRCTRGSQDYLIALANGLQERMAAWEKYELAPKIRIRNRASGKVAEIREDEQEMWQELLGDNYEVVSEGFEMDEAQARPVDWR